MAPARTRQVIIAQTTVAPEAQETSDSQPLPPDFANRVGWLAHINQVTQNELARKYQNLDVMSVVNKPGGLRERLLMMKAVRPQDGDFLRAVKILSGKDVDEIEVQGLRIIINNPFDGYNENEIETTKQQLEGYASGGAMAAGEVRRIANSDTMFKNDIARMQSMTSQRGVQVPPIKADGQRSVVLAQMPAEPQAAVPMPGATPAPAQDQDPLSVDKFESVEQLRQTLIQLGPNNATYDKLFDLVGPDNEDSAKSALAKFFEGSPGGLCVLYDLLVKAGVASPIDQKTIGELMDTHPNIFPQGNTQTPTPAQTPMNPQAKITLRKNTEGFVLEHEDGRTITASKDWDFGEVAKVFGYKGDESDVESASKFLDEHVNTDMADDGSLFDNYMVAQASFHGLYLPPSDASMTTMEKTAGRISEPYIMSGPGDTRMCPKIRNVVSTYTCRFHCLDGLVVDDAQVLCGEAIWRQAVMDKFSREYKDADGNWVGGYINKRFEVDRTTHEHPYQLKPGQRQAPINEDAWSTEKRLQEMRESEGSSRGYSETPGDPKVYNFDQHELAKGPKNPDVAGKDKDPIAKIASNMVKVVVSESMFKAAGDPKFKGVEWAEPEPQEGIQFEGEESKKKDEKKKEDDKKEEKKAFNFTRKTAQMAPLAPPPGGSAAMGDFDKVGQRAERCSNPGCKKVCAMGTGVCPNCGSKTVPYHMSEIMNDTGAIAKPSIQAATFANGVYMVTKDGRAFFGATLTEAQSKMRGVVPMAPGSVQEEADQLENIIQEDTGMGQAPAQVQQPAMDATNMQAQPVQPNQAAPAAPVGQMPAVAPVGVVPAVSDDIAGGDEEVGLGPHIDAGALDNHMARQMVAEEPQDRQKRTEEFASYGLGADPKKSGNPKA